MSEGRKVFFSEEKKQKTFSNSGVCATWKVRDSIGKKSFGSFLQKRTLPSLALDAIRQNLNTLVSA